MGPNAQARQPGSVLQLSILEGKMSRIRTIAVLVSLAAAGTGLGNRALAQNTAAAAPPNGGPVVVRFPTRIRVNFVPLASVGSDGKSHTLSGLTGKWSTDPAGHVLYDGRIIVAKKLQFALRTNEGSSTWESEPSDFDQSGNLTTVITDEMMKQHYLSVLAQLRSQEESCKRLIPVYERQADYWFEAARQDQLTGGLGGTATMEGSKYFAMAMACKDELRRIQALIPTVAQAISSLGG
jgi:hypothetical protein